MPPASSLAALMASPATSHGDATVMGNGQQTLPDISLGSLGSSFKSEDEEELPPRTGVPRPLGLGKPSRIPRSPETSQSPSLPTPSPPRAALLTLSPPPTIRKASSSSALHEPASGAPRRPRVLHRRSISSGSSDDDDDVDGPLEARYGGGGETTDDEAVLSSLSLVTIPKRVGGGRGYMARPSKRSGRHSVAAGESGPMTLRDQEKQLEETKKEVFNLQLENHFLKERLSNMAPEHIEAALKENVKLKLEILTLGKELKKLKKLVMQQDRDLAAAARENGGSASGEARELERLWKDEKERRKAAEGEMRRLQEELQSNGSGVVGVEELREQLQDAEASENVWRQRTEQLEGELEDQKALNDDQAEQLARLQDTADRAQEEVEQLRGQVESARGLRDSVGIGKGREGRMAQKVQELEHENAALQKDLSMAKKETLSEAEAELLEERLNELQDKLAEAQLDVDRRDREIEELNAELDAKHRDTEAQLEQVAEEWRDELRDAVTQVDELKGVVDELQDALDAKDQETAKLREAFDEREGHLTAAVDEISQLRAAKAETAERLEETLQQIKRDDEAKDGELLEANHEIENLGQRVYELEEAIEEYRAREEDLAADLRSADEEAENLKTHYQDLVSALKEKRRKLQDDVDDALTRLQASEDAHAAARDAAKRQLDSERSKHRQALAEKDTLAQRLQAELEAARDRVALRDRDLAAVEHSLHELEDERRKAGDEHTSDRFGLQLELERVQRDLGRCEDELEIAKRELEKRDEGLRSRDIEVARMLDSQRDLENRLASERQGRLNISDKLDQVAKTAKQHEREANLLRERIEELEPLLTETQQERFQLQRQSETQRQERSELLLRVFKDVNKFLGAEDHTTPANFTLFRNTLLQRLGAMISVRTEFEKKIKDTEASVDQRMASLKKQLEQKWRSLDNFEASVKKLELKRSQWRSKLSIKEGELEAAKSQNAELASQISSFKAGSTTESSAQIRSLSERALAAEKRATNAMNQLAAQEARMAEYQGRAGQAENKWEARVKEYENRLRIAGEKIKTEKQGGKERAMQLEAQVRDLEKQVSEARKRNARAEGVVASAAHLMPDGSERERGGGSRASR